jgi:hypothetical protein
MHNRKRLLSIVSRKAKLAENPQVGSAYFRESIDFSTKGQIALRDKGFQSQSGRTRSFARTARNFSILAKKPRTKR